MSVILSEMCVSRNVSVILFSNTSKCVSDTVSNTSKCVSDTVSNTSKCVSDTVSNTSKCVSDTVSKCVSDMLVNVSVM